MPTQPVVSGSIFLLASGLLLDLSGNERVRQGNTRFAGERCFVDLKGYMEGAHKRVNAPRLRSLPTTADVDLPNFGHPSVR